MHREGVCTGGGYAQGGRGGCTCILCIPPGYAPGQVDQKHGKEEVTVRRNSWREMLLELPHENTGFEALQFHGEAK
jgi:hypothetical protein